MRTGIRKIPTNAIVELVGAYDELNKKDHCRVIKKPKDLEKSYILDYIKNIPVPDCNCSNINKSPDKHKKNCPIWLYSKLSSIVSASIDVIETNNMDNVIIYQDLLQKLYNSIQNIIR